VLTNFFSLPLVNTVGLFLEESEEKDYLGLLSFIALSYIMVPFQAYASIKGFLEKEEGPWFRTPKTGKITDIFTRGRFYRWVTGIIPGRRPAPAVVSAVPVPERMAWLKNPYVVLATANNQFNEFQVKPKRLRWVSKAVLVVLLVISVTLLSMTKGVSFIEATEYTNPFFLTDDPDSIFTTAGQNSYKLMNQASATDPANTTAATVTLAKNEGTGWKQFRPGETNSAAFETAGNCTNSSADGDGWVWETAFEQGGTIASGAWTFYFRETDDISNPDGHIDVCAWRVAVSGGSISPQALLFDSTNSTAWDTSDIWSGGVSNYSSSTDSVGAFTFNANEYLYVEFYMHFIVDGGPGTSRTQSIATGDVTETEDPRFTTPKVTIPEKLVFLMAAAPFIPMIVLWLKKRKEAKELLMNNN